MAVNSISRQAKLELAKRKIREHYRRNPMDWLRDRLGEDPANFKWSDFDPAYKDHQWDGDPDPLFASWSALATSYGIAADGGIPDYRIFGLEAATGVGKTYFLARLMYWFLDCFPNSLVITSAPVQAQLKIGVWSELSNLMPRIKRQHPRANLYSLRLMMDDKTGRLRSAEATGGFDNFYDGWLAMGYVAGADKNETSAVKARGFHRQYMLIILEEASGMNNAVVTAFQNTSTGNFNYIFAVGNPSSKSDALHQLVGQPNVLGFRASSLDHPNIVMGREVISGAVTTTSVQDRERTYGRESRLFEAMVRGICPEQSFNALIHGEWLDRALQMKNPDDSYNAAGVDVAASENGDKGAVAIGRANILDFLNDFPCPDATHLGNNLLFTEGELAAKGIPSYGLPCIFDYEILSDCVGVDSVGVGVATVECFKHQGYDVTALSGGQWKEVIPEDKRTKLPMWSFNNLRSQMYWELREDLRNGRIGFKLSNYSSDNPKAFTKEKYFDLRRELLAINFDNSSQRISIESKEDIKRKLQGKSPNLADAVAYWNWCRKRYRPIGGYELPVWAGA